MKRIAFSALGGLLAAFVMTACNSVPKGPASVELFNGKDLDGWKHVLADPKVGMNEVWSVKDGMIICKGAPVGFIHAGKACLNFRLVVEYRWAPGAKPGNSGIFSRINDASKALPRCVETQLAHGSAGDVLGLQGMTIATNQARFFFIAKHALAGDISGVKKTVDAEAPDGEWNHVEIVAEGPNYTVWVNGQKVNEVTGVETAPGPVGLQSEGGEIHYRKVTLTPL